MNKKNIVNDEKFSTCIRTSSLIGVSVRGIKTDIITLHCVVAFKADKARLCNEALTPPTKHKEIEDGKFRERKTA